MQKGLDILGAAHQLEAEMLQADEQRQECICFLMHLFQKQMVAGSAVVQGRELS